MYQLLMLLHIGGVILFVGTIVTAMIWQRAAAQSQNVSIVAHTYRMLNCLDVFVTPITVVTIAVTGVLLARLAGLPLLRTGWIFWSLVVWSVSGILFAIFLFPLQKRLAQEAGADALQKMPNNKYMRLTTRWAQWAHLILIGIVIAFCLMVLKPALPAV